MPSDLVGFNWNHFTGYYRGKCREKYFQDDPNCVKTTGVYSWTASAYGCDTVCPVTGCVNVSYIVGLTAIRLAFFMGYE